jgi:hypothetical protein
VHQQVLAARFDLDHRATDDALTVELPISDARSLDHPALHGGPQ